MTPAIDPTNTATCPLCRVAATYQHLLAHVHRGELAVEAKRSLGTVVVMAKPYRFYLVENKER